MWPHAQCKCLRAPAPRRVLAHLHVHAHAWMRAHPRMRPREIADNGGAAPCGKNCAKIVVPPHDTDWTAADRDLKLPAQAAQLMWRPVNADACWTAPHTPYACRGKAKSNRADRWCVPLQGELRAARTGTTQMHTGPPPRRCLFGARDACGRWNLDGAKVERTSIRRSTHTRAHTASARRLSHV